MLRSKGMLLALIVALSVLVVPLSRAQDDETNSGSHARIVRLSYAEGTVELGSDRGVENATMNVPITEGNRLTTSSNGWAEVQLEDGSTVRLAPSTQVTFTELGRASSGSTLTAVDLDDGEAEFNVSRRRDDQFAVTARNKTILVKHSGRFRVTSINTIPLQIVVFKGEVSLKASDSGRQVAIKKGETFNLNLFDPAHYSLDNVAWTDDLDNWSKQRDEALSAYASKESGYSGESPYQYGLSDLNYYGNYYDVPGYGYLWQPYGAGFGWDPFMNGYWTPSPFGYCWVSAYPWGWLPYRYGNWVFVNGYGWMWQPGSWGGWWRRPHLVNSPPGFHPPAPPPQAKIGIVTKLPLQVPRLAPQPGTTPRRRVFTNEDVQSTSSPSGSAIGEVDRRRGSAGITSARPQPGVATRQTPETHRPDTTPGNIQEVHRAPVHVPSRPAAPQPSAPVIHAQPAPAPAPARPASPPPAPPAPAPAPHLSSPPPPAPRSFSPPAESRSEGGSMSRGSAPTSSARPK